MHYPIWKNFCFSNLNNVQHMHTIHINNLFVWFCFSLSLFCICTLFFCCCVYSDEWITYNNLVTRGLRASIGTKKLHKFRNVVAKLYSAANGSIIGSFDHKHNHPFHCDFVQTGKIVWRFCQIHSFCEEKKMFRFSRFDFNWISFNIYSRLRQVIFCSFIWVLLNRCYALFF